eukprot:Awhi_evm1s15007
MSVRKVASENGIVINDVYNAVRECLSQTTSVDVTIDRQLILDLCVLVGLPPFETEVGQTFSPPPPPARSAPVPPVARPRPQRPGPPGFAGCNLPPSDTMHVCDTCKKSFHHVCLVEYTSDAAGNCLNCAKKREEEADMDSDGEMPTRPLRRNRRVPLTPAIVDDDDDDDEISLTLGIVDDDDEIIEIGGAPPSPVNRVPPPSVNRVPPSVNRVPPSVNRVPPVVPPPRNTSGSAAGATREVRESVAIIDLTSSPSGTLYTLPHVYVAEKNLKCPVCMDMPAVGDPINVLVCGHFLCKGCLAECRDRGLLNCSYCRRPSTRLEWESDITERTMVATQDSSSSSATVSSSSATVSSSSASARTTSATAPSSTTTTTTTTTIGEKTTVGKKKRQRRYAIALTRQMRPLDEIEVDVRVLQGRRTGGDVTDMGWIERYMCAVVDKLRTVSVHPDTPFDFAPTSGNAVRRLLGQLNRDETNIHRLRLIHVWDVIRSYIKHPQFYMDVFDESVLATRFT